MLGVKVLMGTSLGLAVTAGSLATWTVQDPGFVSSATWMPLGVSVVILVACLGGMWRATKYLGERDRRMDKFDRRLDGFEARQEMFGQRQDRLMSLLIGTEDQHTGIREGGIVDDVKMIRRHIESGGG